VSVLLVRSGYAYDCYVPQDCTYRSGDLRIIGEIVVPVVTLVRGSRLDSKASETPALFSSMYNTLYTMMNVEVHCD
jgi:hypothetical protein